MRTTMDKRVVWQKGNRSIERIVKGNPSYQLADQIGERLGYGLAVLIESHEGSLFDRVYNFPRDVRNAMVQRIPLCCGINFAWDSLTNRQHVIHRWISKTQYVPCWVHLRKMGGREPVPEGTF